MQHLRQIRISWWRTCFITIILALCLFIFLGFLFRPLWQEVETSLLIASAICLIFFISLLIILIFVYIDGQFVRPLLVLGQEFEARAKIGLPLDDKGYENTMVHQLAVTLAAASKSSVKPRFSEILDKIDKAVVLANSSHEVIYANDRAKTTFQNEIDFNKTEALIKIFDLRAIETTLSRLKSDKNGLGERILLRWRDQSRTIPARITMLEDHNGTTQGYILGFHDLSTALFELRGLERAYLDILQRASRMNTLAAFHAPILSQEASNFSLYLKSRRKEVHDIIGQTWPKGRVRLFLIGELIRARLPNIDIKLPKIDVVVRADISAITEAIVLTCNNISLKGAGLIITFDVSDNRVKFLISHQEKIPIRVIEESMTTAITVLPSAPTAGEILEMHQTEIWPHNDDNISSLALILPRVNTMLKPQDPRPLYVGDSAVNYAGHNLETKLNALEVVVFDTETTGLDPRNGDKVVQISAVSTCGYELIDGDVFNSLVNPERNIPKLATDIHGISSADVKNAPVFSEVASSFYQFTAGRPLLAHNAAFDMSFLKINEKSGGPKFDQPVLDTVFISAFIFEFSRDHTLDELCRRLDITIPPEQRHTALGDAIATAKSFTRLIPLLEARGIKNLGQLLEIEKQMLRIKRAQSIYQ